MTPKKISADKVIKLQGSSWVIMVTTEARAIGAKRGDLVRVTLERIEPDSPEGEV